MSAIVPFTAAEATPYLAQLANLALEHREEVKGLMSGGAKTIQRAWRKHAKKRGPARKKFKAARPTKDIGKHPNEVSATKKYAAIDQSAASNRDTRLLYVNDVTTVPRATSGNDIDSRQRDIAYIQGVSIAHTIQNNLDRPLHCNMAMVMNRKDSNGPPTNDNFFRGTGNTRGLDFDQAILTANDFRSRPLNNDKFVVLWHQRLTLATADNTNPGYEPGWKSSYYQFDKYTPINRMITYDSDTGVANNRVYFIYWFDSWQAVAGQSRVADAATTQTRIIVNFKEPKVQF